MKLIFCTLLTATALTVMAQVKTGLQVLDDDGFKELRGKHVGLITNPSGVTADRKSAVDLLFKAEGVKLVALFGPEHGVRGDTEAGSAVAIGRDPKTGLPEYSLYGKTRKPTTAMLKGVDCLVYDIQDIGSRSYTYISTLGNCMESAAEHHLPIYVLDRPNPLGGNRVEGNILQPGYKSFVGQFPIAYCYGLTVGELATMINGEGWNPKKCDLHVVQMEGWKRNMLWIDTGLPWIPTSPNVPYDRTAVFYSVTGIVGELSCLSIGIGSERPFEYSGAPKLSGHRLADHLQARSLAGWAFNPASWKPSHGVFTGQVCAGVQIVLQDPNSAELTKINFEVMDALRAAGVTSIIKPSEQKMFDLVCGTNSVRKMFESGAGADAIWTEWNRDADKFKAQRKKYLLYN